MDGTQPVFELADGRLAVERFDLATDERAAPADGLVVPGPLDLFCGLPRNAIEEPLGNPNAVALREPESVVEDLLGRRSHVLILRGREPVGYQSARCASLRPPLAQGRLQAHCDGRVRHTFKSAWRVPEGEFFRSHRGALVRLDRIRGIEPAGAGTYELLLDHPDGPKVPLGSARGSSSP